MPEAAKIITPPVPKPTDYPFTEVGFSSKNGFYQQTGFGLANANAEGVAIQYDDDPFAWTKQHKFRKTGAMRFHGYEADLTECAVEDAVVMLMQELADCDVPYLRTMFAIVTGPGNLFEAARTLAGYENRICLIGERKWLAL